MYQKCVCFIFLVILAVLSCSGFRIDSLAMTDLTKKNHFPASSSSSSSSSVQSDTYANADRYFRGADPLHRPHKIRHHRLWRTQAHNRLHKSPHIDAIVYPPTSSSSSSSPTSSSSSSPTSSPRWPYKSSLSPSEPVWFPRSSSSSSSTSTNPWSFFTDLSESISSLDAKNSALALPTLFPNENFAQIPPTELAPPVVSRSQRSPEHRQHQEQRKKIRWSTHQNEDIFTKTYRAKYVVIAEVESKPRYINESNGSCQYYVKVIRDFKGNAAKSFGLVHKFLRHMLTARCDLVKEMKNSKKYMLLLNENLQLLDAPKPKEKLRQAMIKRLKKVCKPGFVPTKPHVVELKEVAPKKRRKERKNRILICSVRGFPLPKITWKRRNEVLHQRWAYNVLYKRRQSKLVIKKSDAEFLGQYECVAESLSGHISTKNFTLLPPQPSENISSDKECPSSYKENLCQNGGTCFYESSMNFYGCICPENYSGEKCEVKNPGNTRFLMDYAPLKRREKSKKAAKVRH